MARYEAKTDVTGSVWKILTGIGERVEAGGTIMIVESMKMEIPVIAEDGGTIRELRVAQGQSVTEGQAVAVLET